MHSFKNQAKDSFKRGFKRARTKHGLTQEEFVKRITERYGRENEIPISTVRNWEQGRSVPDASTLLRLCDFFECDLDFLFDRISYDTHNLEFICETTGLSSHSISYLIELKQFASGKKSIKGLNILLGSANFENALSYIPDFVEELRQQDVLIQEKKEYLSSFSNIKEYKPNLFLNNKITEQRKETDLSEFQVSNHFSYILRELRRLYNPTSFEEEKRNGKHKKD